MAETGEQNSIPRDNCLMFKDEVCEINMKSTGTKADYLLKKFCNVENS